MFKQGVISSPIWKDKTPLPEIFEDYIRYYERIKEVGYQQVLRVRRTLTALDKYLQIQGINLEDLNVFYMDSFLFGRNRDYAPETKIHERSALRGFLRYLYQERNVLKKDLSVLIQGPPMFARDNPPKFLTSEQIKKLFQGINTNNPRGLRSYAMIHLAFSLGLRPKEISLISLDDIFFQKKEISIPDRKNSIPARLPLPQTTIKALAAYIAWDRPKDPGHRFLLCSTLAPYGPLAPLTVSLNISDCFRNAGIPGSAYWLRHTHAQKLLKSDASIFEIKEMLGHDNIKTSKKYLHINTELMRKVLFDEEI